MPTQVKIDEVARLTEKFAKATARWSWPTTAD